MILDNALTNDVFAQVMNNLLKLINATFKLGRIFSCVLLYTHIKHDSSRRIGSVGCGNANGLRNDKISQRFTSLKG